MTTRTFKRNGGKPSRAQANKGPKKAKKVWKNIAGYECGSRFTARMSSQKLARHWTAACGCDPSRGFRCKAVKNLGQDYDSWGSKGSVTIPRNLYA